MRCEGERYNWVQFIDFPSLLHFKSTQRHRHTHTNTRHDPATVAGLQGQICKY